MVKEVAELGFERMELSHGIRVSLVPGILKAVEEGLIRIGTCHNFCPLPAGVLHPSPNLYQPSSLDGRELDQWVRHTKRSLDFARMIGAGLLVCHLGSVGFFWFDPARKLQRYMEKNPKADYREDLKFTKLRSGALVRLRKAAKPHLARLDESIKRVLDYAGEKGIQLGFENREHFNELPHDDGFDSLFQTLPEASPAGYWHDCGHADIKEKMGLLDHKQHLEQQAHRLLGFHIHDVTDSGHDHQEVGTGHIDFGMISQFWRPWHRFVLELSPRLKPEQVLRSKELVEHFMRQMPKGER